MAQERTRCEAGSSPGTLLPSRAALAARSRRLRVPTIPLSVMHKCSLVRSWIGPIDSWSDASCSQKRGRSYSGVEGIAMQDASLQEAMGPVQDRTKEHLCMTDKGNVGTRSRLL